MTKDAERLLEEARKLSPEERAGIAEVLLQSVDYAREDIEAAWTAEIQRRMEQAEAGELERTDWRAVLDQVQREVLGR